MNWKPGDRALVDWLGADLHGEVITIDRGPIESRDVNTGLVQTVYLTDIPPPGYPDAYYGFRAEQLRPIYDDYDGLQKSTWDDLGVWKPKELVT